MTSLLRPAARTPLISPPAHVLQVAAHPQTAALLTATDTPELLYGESRATLPSASRTLAIVRYARYAPDKLPDEQALALVLADAKLHLYALPALTQVEGGLAEQLAQMSKGAHVLSVDGLGADLVGESFRVAVANESRVGLIDVNPGGGKVVLLGEYVCAERVVHVAFSEMTIVASTQRAHYMLRISRGGGLAVAASVPRSEEPRKQTAGGAVGDGGAAMLSFLGGFFGRKGNGIAERAVAFALPQNRWLLVVDNELVTYSSFGAKLEELENVFKSRSGMDLSDAGSVKNEGEVRKGQRASSASSFASVATGVSHRTFLDETLAARPEKPPVNTIFSSPFVFSITGKNELMAFASNGSIPGVLEQFNLTEGEEKPEQGVQLVATRSGRTLASAYWPSGKMVAIELVDDLDALIDRKESEEELRLALALVPAGKTDRMISLRRRLAVEARNQEWHDAAIYHMENVVNLSVAKEGTNQVDLVTEAVELRGPKDGTWQEDEVTATLWADFLFRLRRRIMRPSASDKDVLETLCRADASASRIKSLLSVAHDVPLAAGESLIASKNCALREEERVEALVALYTSLSEHGKALLLLENSNSTNSFNGVAGYLSGSMRASDDPEAFFAHLRWLTKRAKDQAQGQVKLQKVVLKVAHQSHNSVDVLGRIFEVLVEDADELLDAVVDDIGKSPEKDMLLTDEKLESNNDRDSLSADVFASALLSGMARADMLEKHDLFDKLRGLFNSRILHHSDAKYHSNTLLQALQAPQHKALCLHEELAFLLGKQGRHEAAADELAAEQSLAPEEALSRLLRMLPAADKAAAPESLISAYLRVSAQGRALRTKDAGDVLRCGAGVFDIEKVLLDGRCSDDALTLGEMRPFLTAAIVSGSERLRLAEMLRALRKSEVRRLREEVLTRRRRFVLIGHDRACTLCTRRIGDSVFAAYPDGSVAHLACHMSRANR